MVLMPGEYKVIASINDADDTFRTKLEILWIRSGETTVFHAELKPEAKADADGPSETDPPYASLSPFEALRFTDMDAVEVKLGGKLFILTAIGTSPSEKIIRFAERTYGPQRRPSEALPLWKKRISEDLVEVLAGVPGWLKVGGELFTVAGPPAIAVASKHAKVFLDTKLYDIPNTVARTVAAATHHGVSMLTLHASGGRDMLRAARAAAEEAAAAGDRPRPLLVGVTVLTSFSSAALTEVGFAAAAVAEASP